MKTKFKPILFIVLAFVAIAIGVYVIYTYKDGFVKTTATVTNILYDDYYNNTSQSYAYVSYYVDDTFLEGIRTNWYSANMKIGKDISILYKLEDPTVIKSAFPITGCVIIGVGAVLLIIGISFSQNNKQMQEFEEKRSNDPNYNENKKEGFFDDYFLNKDDPTSTYIFKMGKDFQLLDDKRTEVASLTVKISGFLKPTVYELTNKLSNKSVEVTIGNSVTTTSSSFLNVGFKRSKFIMDGVNCWDYFTNLGFDITYSFKNSIAGEYSVVDKDGKTVVKIGLNNFKDMLKTGIFKVETNPYYLSLALLACLTIQKTMSSSTQTSF